MQHQEWQELIPFYIAQTLAPKQKQAFELHLANCDACQQEIDDWRMIASAVWREADSAAHQLPPLSQDVYNRLNYRDRTPSSRLSANPPQQTRRQAIRQQSRQRTVPVTMVAGIAVALIFGALLIGLAMRDIPDNAQQIAFQGGGGSDTQLTQAFGGGIGGGIEATATPIGIIPTEVNNLGTGGSGRTEISPSFTPVPIVTNTPFSTPIPYPTDMPPTVPPSIGSTTLQNTTVPQPVSPTYTHTAQPPIELAPVNEGNGPYITLTPNTIKDGAPLCEAFNPTNTPIAIYAQANYASAVNGFLTSGEVVRTIVISKEGWYFVVLPSLQRGWIAPQTAYLRGNCTSDVLWLATPTLVSTPAAATPLPDYVPATEARVAVISAAYADLYLEPFNSDSVVGVAGRGEQFSILAYMGTQVQIALGDGRNAWVWVGQITDYAPNEVPITLTPTIEGR